MLTGKYRQGEKGRADRFGGKVFQPENSTQRTEILDTVLAIAGELGVSADQVALAWAGTHGAVPIIGPRSLTQLTSNLGGLVTELTNEQIKRLDDVSNINPSVPVRNPIAWASDSTKVLA